MNRVPEIMQKFLLKLELGVASFFIRTNELILCFGEKKKKNFSFNC